MGKLADTLRNVALPLDKKNQVLALDREFEELKTGERRVVAANVKLRAGALRAARTPAVPKKVVGHGEVSVADITEKILAIIADTEIPKKSIIKRMGLTVAIGNRHIDVLLGKQYIVQSHATTAGVFFRTTAEGRAYLAHNDNL